MRSLGTVFAFEFNRTIKKRSFWLSILALPAILIVVLVLSVFSNKVSDQADQKVKQESFSILMDDESGLITPAVVAGVHATTVSTKADGIARVKAGQADAFFYYPAHPVKQNVEVYAKDDGLMNNNKYTAVATSVLQASLAQAVGSSERATLLQTAPNTTLTTYVDGQVAKGFERVIVPGAFLVLFYIIVVTMGNQMLTSTTEEKENRVIEMILTSVKARTLIIGKILSLTLLGAIQVTFMATPLLVGYFVFRSQLHIPQLDLSQLSFAPAPIIVGALLYLGGFLLFTGLLVTIGSAVPTAKEAGSFFGFAIMSMFIPMYALAAIISSPDQLIVKVMSFFPLTAPITLLLRNAVGNLSVTEAGIGLAIIYVAAFAALALAIRTFRYGTLEYSRRLSLKELFTRRA